MNALTFDDYSYHARSTAFFLHTNESSEQSKIVYYGYNEEVNELLTDPMYPAELTAKLWGHEVAQPASSALDADKVSEAGDVLFYITAAGILRNIPLRDIAAEAIERYTGNSSIMFNESVENFDALLEDRMGEPVPVDYRPKYIDWKLWDFAPFENSIEITMREPTYAKGPLTLIGDGRYALERLHSTFGRYMLPESSTENEFMASASLALGGLSAVLQNRFNSSLLMAAENNISKRERRFISNSLQSGQDFERSRKPGEQRPQLDHEQSAVLNLLNAPMPN